MNAVEEFMNYAVQKEVKFRLGNSAPTQFSYSRRRKPYHITLKFSATWAFKNDYSTGEHRRERLPSGDDGRTYHSVEITIKNPKTKDWAAVTVRRLLPEEMISWMEFAFEFLGIPLEYSPTAAEARAEAAEHARKVRQQRRENGRKAGVQAPAA